MPSDSRRTRPSEDDDEEEDEDEDAEVGEDAEEGAEQDDPAVFFRWFRPEENPFGILLLDIRPFTRTMVSFTKDPAIAESFANERDSDGSGLVEKLIDGSQTIPCSLSFDLPTPRENGPLFKADCMEDKWDIYHHDGKLLFARSWTGDLMLRCSVDPDAESLVITDIESQPGYFSEAPQHVLFLVMSHFHGLDFPNMLPPNVPRDPTEMAVASFSLFGRRAAYATFENIMLMEIDPDFRAPDAEASP